ncbi:MULTISPECIES: erythromycin esterase family protein [unclassified Streptomyces]|uniref:erythromycin esterase family protein n=1 Tax=unclassified Streptomyces TaxID=2593676 RepID=UPI00136D5ACC|nr:MULTISPECIES: erythromycin esterase family protein [unclassified Streptomyces]NDZ99872.1 erythromycin esterase family protein [Streptomyces sp. SID10116]MYY83195.1 erythromycin esterase family protein [Streptomyces sp. SID335]MYZ19514.1 erythromycin esterase family protein [Streptomyces sp. SID337]NDZ85854.1 erythromycin esterase family protein [Streptomyces sp. SID10115]NEB45747.1 erythromycin esterase family protein [Streptomyces sp. SID339]
MTGLTATALLVRPSYAAAPTAGPELRRPSAGPPAQNGRPAAVRALERAAHPLRTTEPGGGRTADLRTLAAMIGDAEVVGLGEATHGSHEFFAMKERLFRYLVEEKRFTTFALEMSWTAGLRIDEYLQGGSGSALQVAKEALAGSPWEREEFVSLLAWMRRHNDRNPRRRVHFMGNDIGAPRLGSAIFERVLSYVRANRPQDLTRLQELYAQLPPIDDAFAYLDRPLAERRRNAVTARQALDLVAMGVRTSGGETSTGKTGSGKTGSGKTGSGKALRQTAGRAGGEASEWAEQHARNIHQTFAFASLDLSDPQSVSEAERFRDEAMAANTLWWQRRTGDKMLLSAHNGHVGYLSTDPVMYPTTQGVHLRDALGNRYVAVGFTFNRGSFLTATTLGSPWEKVTVPAAAPDMHEHTLDRVHHSDYYVDMRTLPAAARNWLDTARPVYDAGSSFKNDPLPTLAIKTAYDVLIHLHRVHAAVPV